MDNRRTTLDRLIARTVLDEGARVRLMLSLLADQLGRRITPALDPVLDKTVTAAIDHARTADPDEEQTRILIAAILTALTTGTLGSDSASMRCIAGLISDDGIGLRVAEEARAAAQRLVQAFTS